MKHIIKTKYVAVYIYTMVDIKNEFNVKNKDTLYLFTEVKSLWHRNCETNSNAFAFSRSSFLGLLE